MDEVIVSLKNEGNALYQKANYQEAIVIYSKALQSSISSKELHVTILSNRAICYLKISDYESCIKDCSLALEILPNTIKAIYRRALAYEKLENYQLSYKDCSNLLYIEPNNNDGIQIMRRIKALLAKQQSNASEIKNIMDTIVITNKIDYQKQEKESLLKSLNAIVGLCYDDRTHALDFYRKNGLTWIVTIINYELEDYLINTHQNKILLCSIRILSSASTHKDFVIQSFVFHDDELIFNASKKTYHQYQLYLSMNDDRNSNQKISFISICSVLYQLAEEQSIILPCLVLIMNILKHFPLLVTQNLNQSKEETHPKYIYTVTKICGKAFLISLCKCLSYRNADSYTSIIDSISAFISDSIDYFESEKEFDTRLESMETRKIRLKNKELLVNRSKNHCNWAIECGLINVLIKNLDCDESVIRQSSSSCLGKLVNYYGDTESLKAYLIPYLQGNHSEFDYESEEKQQVFELSDEIHLTIEDYRIRASVEAVLLISSPELGIWALERIGGISQLHILIATCDFHCQELAAEVICLAAAMEEGGKLIKSIVASGALVTLLNTPHAGIRAAAASALTKLSIKAKAITEDSSEVASVMNTALSVLKASNAAENQLSNVSKSNANPVKKGSITNKSMNSLSNKQPISSSISSDEPSQSGLVSFSSLDEVSQQRAAQAKKAEDGQLAQLKLNNKSKSITNTNAVTMTSVERSVEILAAMVGKTYIKEEMVHGSYRVAACIPELLKLNLDARSTAAYGVVHILCALTVTNKELRAIALAEKDITPEQFDQMAELQRIKTKDEQGNIIEEKKEETDMDTSDLCRVRIQRIVACDAVKFLVKYLLEGSIQTKESAARTFRQICVEPSIRGAIIQQGGLKACCKIASSDPDHEPEIKKSTRKESAHAIAKTLVTTNPNLLTEHQRLGTIKPLLVLCKDSDATNLQQFESLLALTNILSCGESEHNKFVAERGIQIVHYLIFTEHLMVRCAAVEALCNLSSNEEFIKFMRTTDHIKLWLGLCEEGAASKIAVNDDDNSAQDEVAIAADDNQPYLTARAAAGSLATIASDKIIASIMVKEDCARTIVALLDTVDNDLVHRALIIIIELLSINQSDEESYEIAKHLVEGSVIPSIGVVVNLSSTLLNKLAKEAAKLLSIAMNKKKE